MTSQALLAYILAAVAFQVCVGIGVAYRRRGERQIASAPAPEVPRASAAWSGWREFRVARREMEDRAHTQCSFYLVPLDGAAVPDFNPGQYLTFSLPGSSGRTLIRCYSLSDRPQPSGYRITVKRIEGRDGEPGSPPGEASNHLHDHVRVGDVLKVRAPAGHFHLDRASLHPAVFVAGGIGITPLMSMLRWCIAEQPGRDIHLFYALRRGAEHAFKSTLEDLARTHPRFHLRAVYSRADADDAMGRDYQHAGHVDVALLRNALPHGRHEFYVCGPPPMMMSLVPALRDWGVPEPDIHFEAFGPASVNAGKAEPAQASSPEESFEVRFQQSGRTLLWDGRDANLLEFAERHGIEVSSGCRAGGCGTCETKLVSGTVAYAATPDFEIAAGHCLLCVCTPHSSLELGA